MYSKEAFSKSFRSGFLSFQRRTSVVSNRGLLSNYTSRWRHGVVTFQVIHNSSVCSTACSGWFDVEIDKFKMVVTSMGRETKIFKCISYRHFHLLTLLFDSSGVACEGKWTHDYNDTNELPIYWTVSSNLCLVAAICYMCCVNCLCEILYSTVAEKSAWLLLMAWRLVAARISASVIMDWVARPRVSLRNVLTLTKEDIGISP